MCFANIRAEHDSGRLAADTLEYNYVFEQVSVRCGLRCIGAPVKRIRPYAWLSRGTENPTPRIGVRLAYSCTCKSNMLFS